MEPKPAPPEIDDIDQAPGGTDAAAVAGSATSDPSTDAAPAMPQITPAGLPNLNSQAEEPAPTKDQTPDDPRHQQLEQAAQDFNKTPVPKAQHGSHVGLIIFSTIFVVSALSVLAIYAYLQSK